jgi:hypothetical protein
VRVGGDEIVRRGEAERGLKWRLACSLVWLFNLNFYIFASTFAFVPILDF